MELFTPIDQQFHKNSKQTTMQKFLKWITDWIIGTPSLRIIQVFSVIFNKDLGIRHAMTSDDLCAVRWFNTCQRSVTISDALQLSTIYRGSLFFNIFQILRDIKKTWMCTLRNCLCKMHQNKNWYSLGSSFVHDFFFCEHSNVTGCTGACQPPSTFSHIQILYVK